MKLVRTILLTTILSIACAAIPAVALGHRTSRHRGKHAHVTCTAKGGRLLGKGHAGKGKAGKSRTGKHHTKRVAAGARKCTGGGHSTAGSRGQTGGARSAAGHHAKPLEPSSHRPSSHPPSSHQASRPKETTVSAAPSGAATIAKVLGATCENTELVPEAGDLEAIAQATLCLVDQERARNGELPLQVNAELTRTAEGHSREMVEDDYFAHVSPSGETPLQRIEASGYIPNSDAGYTLGENIAWGTLYLATPKAIVAAWLASPEHLANILNAAYTETGMGVAPEAPASLAEGQPGAIYSQEFGVIEA
ncbi:MAG: CAP domain-containing protein [Solirubrobacteraceae bacterium]